MNSETTLDREGGRRADEQRGRGICASRIFGGFLLIIGTLSLLHTTGLMNREQAGLIIPIGFVALGAYLLIRGR